MRFVLGLLLLAACSSEAYQAAVAHDAGGEPAPRAPRAPAGSAITVERDPCDRVETVIIPLDGGVREVYVTLPCQPFDKLRDLPYPQP